MCVQPLPRDEAGKAQQAGGRDGAHATNNAGAMPKPTTSTSILDTLRKHFKRGSRGWVCRVWAGCTLAGCKQGMGGGLLEA